MLINNKHKVRLILMGMSLVVDMDMVVVLDEKFRFY